MSKKNKKKNKSHETQYSNKATNKEDSGGGMFIVILITVAVLIVGGIFFITGSKSNSKSDSNGSAQTVSTVNAEGKQVLLLTAKGGYTPRVQTAKADTPTVLKIQTKNTFDCSTALVIPSINYSKNLPASGETLVEIPPQKAGTNLKGSCSMGMYTFSINFES